MTKVNKSSGDYPIKPQKPESKKHSETRDLSKKSAWDVVRQENGNTTSTYYNEQGLPEKVLCDERTEYENGIFRADEIHTLEYDEKGNIVNKKVEDLRHDSVQESKYQYDEDGKVIKQKFVVDGKTEETNSYRYDEKGNLIAHTNWNEHDGKNTYAWEYDEENRVTKDSVDYGSDGTIEHYTTYKYDERGNLIEEFNGPDGAKTTYGYDSNNNLIIETREFENSKDVQVKYYETPENSIPDDKEIPNAPTQSEGSNDPLYPIPPEKKNFFNFNWEAFKE